MRPVILCLLLAGACSQGAEVFPHAAAVTVLLDFENPHSAVPVAAMQKEARRILSEGGLELNFQLKDEMAPHSLFNDLLVFKMSGHCTMENLPIGALSDERGALAMTYSTDGSTLSFGQVHCDGVRRSLQRIFGPGGGNAHQDEFGTALGRVMAHEVYHMVAKSKMHTKAGVTKEGLSARQLCLDPLDLSEDARTTLHQAAAASGAKK